jgi:hypothetical protein
MAYSYFSSILDLLSFNTLLQFLRGSFRNPSETPLKSPKNFRRNTKERQTKPYEIYFSQLGRNCEKQVQKHCIVAWLVGGRMDFNFLSRGYARGTRKDDFCFARAGPDWCLEIVPRGTMLFPAPMIFISEIAF